MPEELTGTVYIASSEEAAYARTNARIDEIIANNADTDSNTELIDIRTGYDSTNYTTAGTAVRTQIGNLENKTDNIQVLCDSIVDDGTTRFDSGNFTNHGLNNSGALNSVRYHVSNTSIQTATRDITITPNSDFKVYIYYFDSDDAASSSSRVGWKTTAYTISSGKYYKIVIAKEGQTSGIADIDEFVNAVRVSTNLSDTMSLCDTLNTSVQTLEESVTSLTAKVQSLAEDGTTRFDSANFENYGLNNYGQKNTNRYRVSNSSIQTAAKDITFTPDSGFRVYVHYFDSNGDWESAVGWETGEYTIESGKKYKLLIARVSPEDTSETADVDEFVDAVKVSTFLSEVVLKNDINGYKFILPDYYRSHLNTKIAAIKALQQATGYEGATYAFITDMHYPGNKLSSIPLLERIQAQVNAVHLFYGGDSVRAEGTKQNLIDDNYAVARLLCQVYGDDYSYIFGNHDYRINTGTTNNPVYASIQGVRSVYRKGFRTNDNVKYHYWDDEVNQIRHIFIDYTLAGNDTFKNWFGTAALAAPSGYGLCFYCHTPFIQATKATGARYDPVAPTTEMLNLRDWICAVANKGTFGSYDYSNTDLYVIYGAFGHIHQDTLTTYNNVKFFSTTCDAMYNDDGYSRTSAAAGTTSENAFDVITINKSTKMVYLTRIGAGSDRSFSYDINSGTVVLPNQEGIVGSFTAGVGVTANSWQNQANTSNNMTLHGAEFTDDYVKLTGYRSNPMYTSSYGLLEVTPSMACTIYIVFKTENLDSTNQNRYVCGFSGAGSRANWWTIAVDIYATPHYINSDMCEVGIASTVTSSDYHVATIVRDSNGYNNLYIDGVLYGSSIQFTGTPHQYFGLGSVFNSSNECNQNDENRPVYVKYVGIINAAQTQQQIASNHQYLMTKYSIT